MKIILALIVILALTSSAVGGTFAGFSDSEISEDNFLTTGSLDLKVAKLGSDFCDDGPWGVGLEPSFGVTEVSAGETYTSNLLLWNAGTVDGTAGLHLEIVDDPQNLAPETNVSIWYDVNGDGEIETEIVSMTLTGIAVGPIIQLGPLPANQERPLQIQVTPNWEGPPDYYLIFDILFSLVDESWAFSDTEQSLGYLNKGGTPGFWSSPAAVKFYGKDQLAAWFEDIVLDSEWYDDSLADGDVDERYNTMRDTLIPAGSFDAQYLATRLNAISGRLDDITHHSLSGIPGAEDYLGPSPATLTEIIERIEGKFSEAEPQLELMKDVCEALNELEI